VCSSQLGQSISGYWRNAFSFARSFSELASPSGQVGVQRFILQIFHSKQLAWVCSLVCSFGELEARSNDGTPNVMRPLETLPRRCKNRARPLAQDENPYVPGCYTSPFNGDGGAKGHSSPGELGRMVNTSPLFRGSVRAGLPQPRPR